MNFLKLNYSESGIKFYLFETFTTRSAFKSRLAGDYFTVLLINSGAVCIEINSKKIHMFANELIVLPKKTSSEVLIMSNQLQICQLSFTREFALKNSLRWPHIGYFEFFISQDISKIYIKKKQTASLLNSIQLLKSKTNSSSRHPYKEETVLLSFNLFLYELARIYYWSTWESNVRHTRNEKIVFHFFKLLEKNSRKEHSVTFYSDALHISSGHLNKTVKLATEVTAKKCIENAIILDAKILLQNNELSILNISEELRFANTAFFSAFFKRHTSLSPSEYRLRLNSH